MDWYCEMVNVKGKCMIEKGFRGRGIKFEG